MTNLFDVDDLWPGGWEPVLALATDATPRRPLEGQGVALFFEKPSARTRNSTEMAVVGLGGHPVYIQGAEVGLDTRESAEDVARTLACYHRVLCARVFDHDVLVRMAARWTAAASTSRSSTCSPTPPTRARRVADLLTLRETLGAAGRARSLAYIGDANNVCALAGQGRAARGHASVRIASPAGYALPADDVGRAAAFAPHGRPRRRRAGDRRSRRGGRGRRRALHRRVDLDGPGGRDEARLAAFAGFTDRRRRSSTVAAPDAVVLHCLPAHRGEEITPRARGPAERGVAPGRAPADAMRGHPRLAASDVATRRQVADDA